MNDTQTAWMAQSGWDYAGPCLTPAEVKARVAKALRAALEEAAVMMEWENPIATEEVQEYIDQYPRIEKVYRPNKSAKARAAKIRALMEKKDE